MFMKLMLLVAFAEALRRGALVKELIPLVHNTQGNSNFVLPLEKDIVAMRKEDDSNPKRRVLDEACENEMFTVSSNLDTRYGGHEGSYLNPYEAKAGCSFSVELNPGKHFYSSISGFQQRAADGNQPMLQYSWSVTSTGSETPLALFSLRGIPTISEQDIPDGFDWYLWHLNRDGSELFREDDEEIDYYHCWGGCGYEREGLLETCGACGVDLRSRFDTMYITLTAYSATEPMVVTITYDLIYTSNYILPEELQVIKTMYNEMCQPWAAPEDWVWENYQLINSEAQGERDTRTKPYCDWMQSMQVEDLSTGDCKIIPGVVCDADGHVSELLLDSVGLRGQFPTTFSTLKHITFLELPSNQISGSIPQGIFSSSIIERIDLSNNFLDGNLPCPQEDDSSSQLKELLLFSNYFSGDIPGCLFKRFTELSYLDLSRNFLQGSLPNEIRLATNLGGLYIDHLGLVGSLDALQQLSSLSNLDASHNYFRGSIDAEFLEAFPRLYELDLSWNLLNGTLPAFDKNINLRRLDLSHNEFSGSITDQFNVFAAQQDRGVLSSLNLADNNFCGTLPEVFYDLLLDAHFFVYELDVSRNQFRCSVSNTFFPAWATVLLHDFGKCIPVPEMKYLENDIIVLGENTQYLYIYGEFTLSTQGTCKFEFGSITATTPAIFESSSRVACLVPSDAPIGQATVTIASYCEDYASTETLGDNFVPMTFQILQQTPAPTYIRSSTSKKSESNQGAVIGGSIAAVIALIFLIFICYILGRERQGKPIFQPNKIQQRNPIHRNYQDEDEEGINLDIVSGGDAFNYKENNNSISEPA